MQFAMLDSTLPLALVHQTIPVIQRKHVIQVSCHFLLNYHLSLTEIKSSMIQIMHFCFYFYVQFHQQDLLRLLLVVQMIRNVLIGMLALILNVKTHVPPILVPLKHFVAPITIKQGVLVQKDGQEIQKSNAYLVRYHFIYLSFIFQILTKDNQITLLHGCRFVLTFFGNEEEIVFKLRVGVYVYTG